MRPTLLVLSLAVSVSAHGWMNTLSAGSKSYSGNEPTQQQPTTKASVIRQVSDNLPVKIVTSADLTCGRDATKASQVATVAAGSTLQIAWKTLAEGGLWFHDVGPMMAYMASCGSGSCADFDASSAKWFKTEEQGQDSSRNWLQAKLDTGAPASVTIPSNLKPGNYLLRHEIIALHTAQSEGGAEFYANCAQLTVTGSGSGAPTASELVSLPGAYKATDAGILIDVYDMTGAYKFPGPAVAAFVSGSSSSPTSGGDVETTTTKASSPVKTTTAKASTPTTGSGSPTCRAKRDRRSKRAVIPAVPEAAPVVGIREAGPVIDIRDQVRRSRVRNLHRAGVHRSF